MAAKIEAALGCNVKLIPAGGGVFDVKVDETLVYSKTATGNFPDEETLVKEMLAAYQ